MPEPKKSPTKRRQGNRRGQLSLKLRRRINSSSPIKIFTTRGETPHLAKKSAAKKSSKTSSAKKAPAKKAVKPATKKAPAKKKPAAKKTKKT